MKPVLFILLFLFDQLGFSQSIKSIDGIWTQDRKSYGMDTLFIENGKMIYTFIYKIDQYPIKIFADISEYSPEKGTMKWIITKKSQGDSVLSVKSKIEYVAFELTENELWTYIDTIHYPDRNYLKINAYRNSWKNKDITKYVSSFYDDKDSDCSDTTIYSGYNFQENTKDLKFYTISPQYPGGKASLLKFINENFNYSESLENYFGIYGVNCFISCTGEIKFINPNNHMFEEKFPETSKQLKSVIERTGKWKPAMSLYKKVSSNISIGFVISEGKISKINIK